ncbi:MAG TPA: hypothetical protein VMV93_11035 [Chloroflexota bacterium]|nr:hypothetical protein [Chloroflexota bacterium]
MSASPVPRLLFRRHRWECRVGREVRSEAARSGSERVGLGDKFRAEDEHRFRGDPRRADGVGD